MAPFDFIGLSTADESFIAVVIGAVVVFIAVAKRLNATKDTDHSGNTVAYRERFLQMKTDAEAKYGPAVTFLRPEMDFSDDPELFEKAWREFQHKS